MAQNLTLTIEHGGKTYTLSTGDFTALDARTFRQTVGIRLVDGFIAPDLDAIAGLLWLHKRRTHPQLRFDDVAKTVTYESIDFNVDNGEAAEEDPNDPEA